MNRNLAPIAGHLYRGVVMLSGRLDITASTGAVAATSVFLGGAATPFVRLSAGLYTLTLNEQVVGPVFPLVCMKKGTAEDLSVEISAEALTGSTKLLTIRTRVAAGTATDATNACSVYIHLILPDSQSNP